MPGFFRRRTGHCRRKRFNVYLRKPTESKVLFSTKRDIYVYEVSLRFYQLYNVIAPCVVVPLFVNVSIVTLAR